MTQPKRTTDQEPRQGEVIISGVDTGPSNAERHNRTPTEDHARFQPLAHPPDGTEEETNEPDNEDG